MFGAEGQVLNNWPTLPGEKGVLYWSLLAALIRNCGPEGWLCEILLGDLRELPALSVGKAEHDSGPK